MQGYYYYDVRDAADLLLDGLSNFLNWNAFANRFLEVVKEARDIQNSLVITPHAAMVISLVCCTVSIAIFVVESRRDGSLQVPSVVVKPDVDNVVPNTDWYPTC